MIKNIMEDVRNLLCEDKSGHDVSHVFRVYEMALQLSKEEEADNNIISLAALLHDCDDYKIFDHESAKNLTNAKAIMQKVEISEETQEKVCDIIQNMGYNKLLSGIRPQTNEGKVVSDADMLDAIGSIGIIRCLAFALHKGGSVFDKNTLPALNITREEYQNPERLGKSFVNHFFEKLLKLKKLMLTNSGKKEAENRHEIMVVFLRQFFVEHNAYKWVNFLDEYLKSIYH